MGSHQPLLPAQLHLARCTPGTGEEGTELDALCGYAVDLHMEHQYPTTSISFPFLAHAQHSGEGGEGGRGLKAAQLCREGGCKGKAGSSR